MVHSRVREYSTIAHTVNPRSGGRAFLADLADNPHNNSQSFALTRGKTRVRQRETTAKTVAGSWLFLAVQGPPKMNPVVTIVYRRLRESVVSRKIGAMGR